MSGGNPRSTTFLPIGCSTDRLKRLVPSAHLVLCSVNSHTEIECLGECCAGHDIPLVMYLAAEGTTEMLLSQLVFVDVLFARELDLKALATVSEDVLDVAVRLTKCPKANGSRSRTVVVLHDDDHMRVSVIDRHRVTQYQVDSRVKKDGWEAVFVGGFLSQFHGRVEEECLVGAQFALDHESL